ncbi:MAG TPA: ATP-binding cassette domain-containing protein [Bacteroidetes bacterium]|nr:ATP-binding cassette domain-containing protein [Bacteroidota bacterium]
MIELIRVSRHFPRGRGIEDISLRVEKGDWVVLVGSAGAGKTTLLRMVYADDRPDSGEVVVGNYRLSSLRPKDLPGMRRQLGIVDADLSLVDDRNVYRNVTLVGEVRGWPRAKTKTAALRVLNRVGLYGHLDLQPRQLSHGERLRLAIARALVAEPEALIADEPLAMMDEATADGIVELLARIHHRGTSLLIATNHPERYNGYPVRRVRLERGRLVEGR